MRPAGASDDPGADRTDGEGDQNQPLPESHVQLAQSITCLPAIQSLELSCRHDIGGFIRGPYLDTLR